MPNGRLEAEMKDFNALKKVMGSRNKPPIMLAVSSRQLSPIRRITIDLIGYAALFSSCCCSLPSTAIGIFRPANSGDAGIVSSSTPC